MERISLEEFCKRLSTRDKRVETIGGFHHYMRDVEKKTKATEAEFSEYFKRFCLMPA